MGVFEDIMRRERVIQKEYFRGDFDENDVFWEDKTSTEENKKFFKAVKRISRGGCEVIRFCGFPGDKGFRAQITIMGHDMAGHCVDLGVNQKTFAKAREMILGMLKERFNASKD